jgi:hypothetical protein
MGRLACLLLIGNVSAHECRKASNMKVPGQIPLRFLHSGSGNFTLPIHKKPISTALLPFSLKKVGEKPDKHATQRLPKY